MATTPTYINQRINNLQSQLNALQPYPPPELQTLSDVLILGNSAGATSIDMNFNNISNINQLSLSDPLLPNENATLDNQSFYINTTGGLTDTQVAILQTQIEVVKDTSTGEGTVLNANELIFQNQTIGSNITSNTDITLTSTSGVITLNAGSNVIKLTAENVNSFNFAMPICFTRQLTDTFSYTLGLQQLENVYTTSFTLPFVFTGGSLYTSTNWKIDFALNTWNNTVVNDKGLACYFALRDTSLNFYLPMTYNTVTPYVSWIQPSLYNDGTNNSFQNFNWSDSVDLAGLIGQGSSATPLDLLLVFAADSAFTCNFNINVSLTRTNLV